MKDTLLPGGFDSFYLDRGEVELGKFIELLRQKRVAAISGESGSGKSVFVTKTLREKLEGGEISGVRGNTWRVVVTTPSNNPVEQLASDLAASGLTSLYQQPRAEEFSYRDELVRAIRTEVNPIGRLCQRVLERSVTPFNLLIVVDGLEDLVRYSGMERGEISGGDDVFYVSAFLAALRGTEPVYVVFSTDTRYMNAFSRYRGLPEVLNNNSFYITLPSPEEIRTGLRKTLVFPEGVSLALADKLSNDYRQLQGHDPFVLEKLRFLFRSGAGRLVVGSRSYTPDVFLKEFEYVNVLSGIIGDYMDEVVTPDLSDTEMIWLSVIFKALTERRADGVWRRPVVLRELIQLLVPHFGQADPSPPVLVDLIRRINSGGYILIDMLGTGQYSRDNVVTIRHDALLFNWPILARWMKEEASHAEVYRLLVRKADNYFGASFSAEEMSYFLGDTHSGYVQHSPIRNWLKSFDNSQDAEQIPRNQYLSEGAELTGAIEWYEICKPGRAWAARYDDSGFSHKNPETPQFRAVFHESNPADVAQIDIATQFLHLSRERAEGLIDRLRRETMVAVRQRRLSRVMTVVAIVAMIISLFFMDKARSDKADLELLDFLGVLSSNGVLHILPSQRDNLRRQVSRVVADGVSVHSKDDLLLLLMEKKLLQVESDHPYYDLILEAIKNMHYIQGQTFSEADRARAQDRILRIYDEIMSAEYNDGRWQHPALYYNLNARLEDAEHRLGMTAPSFEKANVIGSAIAPNSHNHHEYAYGDANGKVFIRNKSESYAVGDAGSPVSSLIYSPSADRLFAGTAEGVLCVFSNLGRGEKPVLDTLYEDALRRPIFGIGQSGDGATFLVMTNWEIYFVRRSSDGSNFVPTGFSQRVEQERVTSFDLSSGNKYLAVSGIHSTILYELDFSGKGTMAERLRVQHPDITMTDVAIKINHAGDNLWIALGGEDGRLWISSAISTSGNYPVIESSDPVFHLFSGAHESTITALEFNPVLPQLFSASIFGEARLWNLNRLNNADDHIYLRNSGKSISAAIYNNENELIIHEVIYGKRVLTNVRAIRAELDLLLEKTQ